MSAAGDVISIANGPAVAAMAMWTGKKMAKTGINSVPSPNPENRVRAETTRAARQTTM